MTGPLSKKRRSSPQETHQFDSLNTPIRWSRHAERMPTLDSRQMLKRSTDWKLQKRIEMQGYLFSLIMLCFPSCILNIFMCALSSFIWQALAICCGMQRLDHRIVDSFGISHAADFLGLGMRFCYHWLQAKRAFLGVPSITGI